MVLNVHALTTQAAKTCSSACGRALHWLDRLTDPRKREYEIEFNRRLNAYRQTHGMPPPGRDELRGPF